MRALVPKRCSSIVFFINDIGETLHAILDLFEHLLVLSILLHIFYHRVQVKIDLGKTVIRVCFVWVDPNKRRTGTR